MGGHRASGAGDDLVDGPVDLAAVRSDDALLDAIAGGGGFGGRGTEHGFGRGVDMGDVADDERIAAILAAWRADIEADPMPELVTVDEAAEAISAGHEARDRVRSRARRRMPFAVAAAAAVLAVSGLTIAVHGAMPGDTLWGVSKVFFSERAQGVERVEEVRTSIQEANAALQQGDRSAAQRALDKVNIKLPALPPPDRQELQPEADKVEESLEPPTRESTPDRTPDSPADADEPTSPQDRPSSPSDPDTPQSPADDPTSPSPTDPSDDTTADPRTVPGTPREQTPPPSSPSGGSSSPSTTQGLSSSPRSTSGN